MPPDLTPDRCPGVLRPHQAVDGALLRLRVPGGRISADALEGLGSAACEFADGRVRLTSRGNLQLRGVRTTVTGDVPHGLLDAVTAAGLLPSTTHERVRNLVASPLTGITGGLSDLRPLVRELDRLICADPLLAGLPGRFLFVLDDGRGDVAGIRADLAVRATDATHVRVVLGGGLAGPALPLVEAAAYLVGLAGLFLRVRSGEWHVRDLPAGGAELLKRPSGVLPAVPGTPMPYGVLDQVDGRAAVSVLAPLGTLEPAQSRELLAASRQGAGELVVTPWRGVVVPGLEPDQAPLVAERLAATALVGDGDSPWTAITACVGAPGCHRAEGNTAQMAREIAVAQGSRGGGTASLVHVVACERRCGSPSGPHTLVQVRSGK